jgi:hypothetical protein
VFDYGCGFGEDVRLLSEAGIEADGWDPYHRPDVLPRPASCINLGYVLNVIEDPGERADTLRKAFDLAREVLIVSVRVDQSLDGALSYADGYLTNHGSFQKLYTQAEFREYLNSALGQRPYVAGLGVAYVFKRRMRKAPMSPDKPSGQDGIGLMSGAPLPETRSALTCWSKPADSGACHWTPSSRNMPSCRIVLVRSPVWRDWFQPLLIATLSPTHAGSAAKISSHTLLCSGCED